MTGERVAVLEHSEDDDSPAESQWPRPTAPAARRLAVCHEVRTWVRWADASLQAYAAHGPTAWQDRRRRRRALCRHRLLITVAPDANHSADGQVALGKPALWRGTRREDGEVGLRQSGVGEDVDEALGAMAPAMIWHTACLSPGRTGRAPAWPASCARAEAHVVSDAECFVMGTASGNAFERAWPGQVGPVPVAGEEAPGAVPHRRFHRPADDLGDEHPTPQRALRANPAPSKSSAGKPGGSPSAPAAALSGTGGAMATYRVRGSGWT